MNRVLVLDPGRPAVRTATVDFVPSSKPDRFRQPPPTVTDAGVPLVKRIREHVLAMQHTKRLWRLSAVTTFSLIASGFHDRSHGYRPLEVNGWLPYDTSPTRLEILPGNVAQPRRELIFHSDDGEKHVVTVPHRVKTVEEFDEYLKEIRCGQPRLAVDRGDCAADDKKFVALIEERFGKIEGNDGPSEHSGYPANIQAATFIKLPPE